jgi:uncharacterized protein (TIGR03118 family)
MRFFLRKNIITPMKTTYLKTCLLLAAAAMFTTPKAFGDTYSWTNFQSDIPGVAQHIDPDLVNPWGMAVPSATGPIWVSDNGTGVSTLYARDGTKNPLVVTVPGREGHHPGNPTGVVFNNTGFFKVTKNGNSQTSRFIFVNEDGTISGWNPALDPTNAIVAVHGKGDAVYKGATLGVANGHNFLFVTNFHRGTVETYDENFQEVNPHGFVDPNIPHQFAPFGIRNFNGQIYVTYAKQAPGKRDDEPGPGNGFINVFDTSGNFVMRLVSQGNLNSPWGLALVEGGTELWVGNFGDGKINNYDLAGNFIETLMRADGTPLQFDGLWDLLPGSNGVFFTAGIADEGHGLFGIITEDE